MYNISFQLKYFLSKKSIKREYMLKQNSSLLNEIKDITNFLPETADIMERFWYIKNNIQEIKKCINCKKPISWDGDSNKFSTKKYL